MDRKLEEALNNVETTYGELVAIANDLLAPTFSTANQLVSQINSSITTLSIDQIRNNILALQLEAFKMSDMKEKSALKAELAEALQREQFAVKFNGLDGSAAVREKLAIVESSPEVVAEALYNLVANLLKTKLDQLHRLVDALKSILMSRMQEAKFIQQQSVGAPGERTYLAE